MAGRGRGRGRGGRVVPVPVPAAPAAPAPAPVAPAPVAPAPVAAAGRGAGRGRGRGGRGVVVPVPAGPAAPAAPAVQPAAAARGRGRGRGGVQPAAEDPADQMAQLSIAGSSAGDPSEAGGSEVSMGRGSVRESRDGIVRVTRPEQASVKAGTEGVKITLSANYFELVKKANWTLYKHHVTVSPEEDRTFVKKCLLRQHAASFTGFLFDGSTLLTLRAACPPNSSIDFQSTWRQGSAAEGTETTRVYKLNVRATGTLEPTHYQYLQFFNVVLRECMETLNLQLLRRDYYDPGAKIAVPEFGLELWPGYTTSFLQCETNVLLQAEIKYRVLRKDTVYEAFTRIQRSSTGPLIMQQALNEEVMGAVVMTKYNEKSYRIDEIDYSETPRSTFEQTKNGIKRHIRYCDYIQERYGLRVSDFNQPMLISKSNARERRAGQAELVYLIPEFCVFTGLTDRMRQNFQLMRGVSSVTCVSPSARIDRLRNFNRRLQDVEAVNDKLNSWGLQLATDLVKFDGRQVPMEHIVFSRKEVEAGREASWDSQLRFNKPLQAIDITKYIAVYLRRNERETRNFCKLLSQVAYNMQYTIAEPTFVCADGDNPQEYTYALSQAATKHNPQIVLCIVPNGNEARYNAIKKRCVLERPIPSQVVQLKNLVEKKAMSVATKVAVQMNCKIGGAPWAVHIPVKGLMTIGFDVCHDPKDKGRSFGAMVSSTDTHCVRWYSNITHHPAGEELSVNFPDNVLRCVQAYQEANQGQVPARIIIYRDGVGEGQVDHVLDIEVKGIKELLKPLYSTENPLRMAFVIVTKRINTRIFLGDRNPPPGTVVDQVITSPFKYDFFLVSQSVRQGTVTPTYYNVIEDTTQMKPDHIQRLTYKFTHMYFNWPGTVRVPAPCQYAHKLALLTSQSISQMHETALKRTLYFL